jgi:hypothetical protein
MMDKAKLLKRLDEAWQALLASYAGLPDSDLLEHGVSGDWSIKDIVAHVTWWEEEALKHLPLVLTGGRPPRYSVLYGGIDAFNGQMHEKKKVLSLSETLNEREDTHRRLVEYIQNTPDDQITAQPRFRRRLRLDTYGHYPEHTQVIINWRQSRAG